MGSLGDTDRPGWNNNDFWWKLKEASVAAFFDSGTPVGVQIIVWVLILALCFAISQA